MVNRNILLTAYAGSLRKAGTTPGAQLDPASVHALLRQSFDEGEKDTIKGSFVSFRVHQMREAYLQHLTAGFAGLAYMDFLEDALSRVDKSYRMRSENLDGLLLQFFRHQPEKAVDDDDSKKVKIESVPDWFLSSTEGHHREPQAHIHKFASTCSSKFREDPSEIEMMEQILGGDFGPICNNELSGTIENAYQRAQNAKKRGNKHAAEHNKKEKLWFECFRGSIAQLKNLGALAKKSTPVEYIPPSDDEIEDQSSKAIPPARAQPSNLFDDFDDTPEDNPPKQSSRRGRPPLLKSRSLKRDQLRKQFQPPRDSSPPTDPTDDQKPRAVGPKQTKKRPPSTQGNPVVRHSPRLQNMIKRRRLAAVINKGSKQKAGEVEIESDESESE